MTFKPAHKQDDPSHKPGQYGFDRYPYLKSGSIDIPPVQHKLTFDEWLHQSSFVETDAGTYQWLKDCWHAAQENK